MPAIEFYDNNLEITYFTPVDAKDFKEKKNRSHCILTQLSLYMRNSMGLTDFMPPTTKNLNKISFIITFLKILFHFKALQSDVHLQENF